MQIHWPYKVLLTFILLIGTAFITSPFLAAQKLAETVAGNNIQQWPQQIDSEYFKKYSRTLLDGLLQAKMAEDSRQQGTREAMLDYQFARHSLNKQADALISPTRFPYLVCGEVTGAQPAIDSGKGCWALKGHLQWQNLTRVVISYPNPQRGWVTRLYLQRTGLLDWQVVDIDLPVAKILKQFQAQLPSVVRQKQPDRPLPKGVQA